jgi:ATP dependent DNA ligase domain
MVKERWRALQGKALALLPDETAIDDEVVALDESGQPSFNTLQNHGSASLPIIYYVFDALVLDGRNVMSEPLSVRRELLRSEILPKLSEPIRHCPELNASLADVIASVRAAGLEGLVAKRLDSRYEPARGPAPGRRCGSTRARNLLSAGTRSARRHSMPSSSDVTRAADYCTSFEPAMASRRPCGTNSSSGCAGWRSPSVHSRICRKPGADAGDRVSPARR